MFSYVILNERSISDVVCYIFYVILNEKSITDGVCLSFIMLNKKSITDYCVLQFFSCNIKERSLSLMLHSSVFFVTLKKSITDVACFICLVPQKVKV